MRGALQFRVASRLLSFFPLHESTVCTQSLPFRRPTWSHLVTPRTPYSSTPLNFVFRLTHDPWPLSHRRFVPTSIVVLPEAGQQSDLLYSRQSLGAATWRSQVCVNSGRRRSVTSIGWGLWSHWQFYRSLRPNCQGKGKWVGNNHSCSQSFFPREMNGLLLFEASSTIAAQKALSSGLTHSLSQSVQWVTRTARLAYLSHLHFETLRISSILILDSLDLSSLSCLWSDFRVLLPIRWSAVFRFGLHPNTSCFFALLVLWFLGHREQA